MISLHHLFLAEGHEMVVTKGQVVPIVGFANYCTKPQQALISHLVFFFCIVVSGYLISNAKALSCKQQQLQILE